MDSSGQRGFTLLELLVVILIIGLISSFAVLSVGGRDDALREQSRRLVALIRLAGEEAIINATDLALRLRRQGYAFAQLTPDGRLQPLQDEDGGSLRPRTLPEDIHIRSARINGLEADLEATEDAQGGAVILLYASGEMTPFEIELQAADGGRYRLRGEFNGVVREPERVSAR